MDNVPILIPFAAVMLGGLVIWLLHKSADTRIGKKYLSPVVITYATTIIVAYVCCVWVLGFILTVLTGAHRLPLWPKVDL